MSTEINPFASPQFEDRVRPRTGILAVKHFISPTLRTRIGMATFAAVILVNVVALVALVQQLNLLNTALQRPITPAEAEANDTLVQLTGTLKTLIHVVSIVVFFCWLYRVHRNLFTFGYRHIDNSTGWAIGCWFVPIAHLFVPCMVLLEVWRKSDPAHLAAAAGRVRRSAAVVGFWWFFHVIMVILGQVLMVSVPRLPQPSIPALISHTQCAIAAYATVVPAALMVILMMWRIGQMQEERSEFPVPENSARPATIDLSWASDDSSGASNSPMFGPAN